MGSNKHACNADRRTQRAQWYAQGSTYTSSASEAGVFRGCSGANGCVLGSRLDTPLQSAHQCAVIELKSGQ